MKFFCGLMGSSGTEVLTWGLWLNLRECEQLEIIHKAGASLPLCKFIGRGPQFLRHS